MTDTSVAPYFDDFDEDKGFVRLLFRPGRAVQTRELTQLQTVLQNQITRFGQNVFKEGSVVIPGGASVDSGYEYVTVTAEEAGSIVAGAAIVGNDSGLEARLLQIVAPEGDDPLTFYVRYQGGGFSDGGRFQADETLTWTNPDSGSGTFIAVESGTGTKIDLQKGIYFVNGFFAAATSQSLIIGKYGIPSGFQEIGLIVAESLVTSDDDSSLLDNSNGTSNFNAPGADRLKYALTLIDRADVDESTQDYFTIALLQDGVIVKQKDTSTYAVLGDVLAQRTFDESGDYTVDPFLVDVADHPTDSSKLILTIDPGRAYVKGYLVDKPLPTSLNLDKALTTRTTQNDKIPVQLGSYVRVTSLTGHPLLNSFEKLNLLDAASVTIGTARITALTHESGTFYRVHLFDVKMNSGKGFNLVERLDGTNLAATLIDDNNQTVSSNAVIKDASISTALFRIPNHRVTSVQDITVRVQLLASGTASGTSLTLDTNSDLKSWESTGDWIVFRGDTGALVTNATFGTPGSRTITVSNLVNGVQYHFIAYQDKTTSTTQARAKTLTTVADSVKTPAGNGAVALGQADIFELVSVKDASNGDEDITSRYILDNGQRDTHYEHGSLSLKASASAPAGNVKVTFKYFAHGAGEYFSPDSYNPFIALSEYSYGDIPTHTLRNGTVIRLADYFDFRSVKTASDTFSSTVNQMPKNQETIQGDVSYYLPRADILWVSSEGVFGITKGTPSLTPTLPQAPTNSMPIWSFILFPGTISKTDLNSTFIENRRYTMRDIGAIESRIGRLEEWTTLSLLEADTASLEVLDADGNNRFKSGFFVDSFNDHSFTNFNSPEHRAALDPFLGELRPEAFESNARLVFRATSSDSESSTGVVQKGDMLMLDYTEVLEIEQPFASSTINVNPYNVITNTGLLFLSPVSDEWRDVETVTNRNTIQETAAVNPVQNQNWNNWQWNWAGVQETNRRANEQLTRIQNPGVRGPTRTEFSSDALPLRWL